MPLDPSIALSVKPIQLDDPLVKQQQIQAMRLNQLQVNQAQRQEQQQATLADLYRTNTGADGRVNNDGMLQGMAQNGLGGQIPGFQKQMADTLKAQADLGKTGTETEAMKFKLNRDRLNASNGMLASLLAKPNVTHDDVMQGVTSIVQQGLASPEQGMAIIKSLPGRPEDLRAFLMTKGIEGMDESKRMEMLLPKFEKMDMGGVIQTGTVNQLTGQFSPQGKALPKTVTPDAVLTANTSAANARLAANTSTANAQLAANTSTSNNAANIAAQVSKNTGKPLPAPALKMQQSDLEAIGIASGTQADLGAIEKQIADGKLNFGGLSNLINKGRNAVGMSTEESRNLSSFKSTLEKLRNDSLRLNAGVQTDGDAQRAWNELFENINDGGVVKQRLAEIKRLNARAVSLRKLNIDNVRANYGMDPLDTSKYENQGAVIGTPDNTPPEIAAIIAKHGGKK